MAIQSKQNINECFHNAKGDVFETNGTGSEGLLDQDMPSLIVESLNAEETPTSAPLFFSHPVICDTSCRSEYDQRQFLDSVGSGRFEEAPSDVTPEPDCEQAPCSSHSANFVQVLSDELYYIDEVNILPEDQYNTAASVPFFNTCSATLGYPAARLLQFRLRGILSIERPDKVSRKSTEL
jgi:hypothetical protein